MEKLDNVIKSFLLEIGDSTFHRYARVMNLAVNGLKELNIEVSGVPKVVELELTDRDTVSLPPDYIQYIKIGVCFGGEFVSLGLNPNKCTIPKLDDCGNILPIVQPQGDNDVFILTGVDGIADNYKNGESVGRFFGLGGGTNPHGYYTIDKERGEIAFSGIGTTDKILLEYIGNINEVNGNFMVHPFIEEPLKAWVWWKMLQRNTSKSLGEKQMAEVDYWKARRNAIRKYQTANYTEWVEAFRKGNKLAPRY